MYKLLMYSLLMFSLIISACSNNEEASDDSNTEMNNNDRSSEEENTNNYASENDTINEEDLGENLIDYDNLEEESWITYEGYVSNWNEEYLLTESIEYNPEEDYLLTHHAYVSYFDGDEFLETILHSEGMPRHIETMEEADNIRVSFNERDQEDIELKKVRK